MSLDLTGHDRKVLELGGARRRQHGAEGTRPPRDRRGDRPGEPERARAIADRVVTADLDRDAFPT